MHLLVHVLHPALPSTARHHWGLQRPSYMDRPTGFVGGADNDFIGLVACSSSTSKSKTRAAGAEIGALTFRGDGRPGPRPRATQSRTPSSTTAAATLYG